MRVCVFRGRMPDTYATKDFTSPDPLHLEIRSDPSKFMWKLILGLVMTVPRCDLGPQGRSRGKVEEGEGWGYPPGDAD